MTAARWQGWALAGLLGLGLHAAAWAATVVVRPGEDIQAAIDSLPEAGGCVCLKVGEHEIEAPIRIEQSNVSLHGETVGARVVRKNGTELLHIGHRSAEGLVRMDREARRQLRPIPLGAMRLQPLERRLHIRFALSCHFTASLSIISSFDHLI